MHDHIGLKVCGRAVQDMWIACRCRRSNAGFAIPELRGDSPSGISSRHALRLPSGGSVQDFLGGAACLLIWGVLWLLTILTFAGRFEGPYAVAHPQQVNSSASLVGPSPSCLPGMIELAGRSIADAPCRGGGPDRQR